MSYLGPLLGLPEGPITELYDSTVQELAYTLSAIAVQDGLPTASRSIATTLNVFGNENEARTRVLALTVERLLGMIRTLGLHSEHPFAENLRTHSNLSAVIAEQSADQTVNEIVAWLDQQDRGTA
ncbi:hypothetical protein [Microbacterium sp. YY-01]|uniref:hypothetical protein n=1 Tax=Microbacterium sp. YY-01 TaxID=3421634 RepID=UPI003D16F04A